MNLFTAIVRLNLATAATDGAWHLRLLPRNLKLTTIRLDLNLNSSRKTQLVQCFDRLRRDINNVNQTLVSTNLILLTRFFINMRTGVDSVTLDPGRERDRTANNGTGTLCSIDDLRRALIDDRVIISLHPDSD